MEAFAAFVKILVKEAFAAFVKILVKEAFAAFVVRRVKEAALEVAVDLRIVCQSPAWREDCTVQLLVTVNQLEEPLDEHLFETQRGQFKDKKF